MCTHAQDPYPVKTVSKLAKHVYSYVPRCDLLFGVSFSSLCIYDLKSSTTVKRATGVVPMSLHNHGMAYLGCDAKKHRKMVCAWIDICVRELNSSASRSSSRVSPGDETDVLSGAPDMGFGLQRTGLPLAVPSVIFDMADFQDHVQRTYDCTYTNDTYTVVLCV